ncbi:SCO6745 family protein [Streptomyces sp. URMC 126]|uniref:SCO6745 family protein n=1 Tax=Streptomyces sp. URMC 126 TaxID=3423401 RepID=UPI003F1C59FA
MTTPSPLPSLLSAGRRCQQALEAVHVFTYFTPETVREFAAFGVEDGHTRYFAERSAAMGRVGAGTVTAAFHVFKYELVARHVPAVWERVAPEEAVAARLRACDAALRRMLGEEVVSAPETAEAAELALRAAEAGERASRPLFAAQADQPVPDAPHLALWHAATLLREHRGGGHLAALAGAGLDPVEALVSHAADGDRGSLTRRLLRTRGWSAEELEEGARRLRERGLLAADGALTAAGAALRRDVEEATDRLDAGPWERLGADGTARLTELAGDLARRIAAAGGSPTGSPRRAEDAREG